MPFEEAIERFIQTSPKELDEALADGILSDARRIKKNINATRKEIADGARPKRGRFRL